MKFDGEYARVSLLLKPVDNDITSSNVYGNLTKSTDSSFQSTFVLHV